MHARGGVCINGKFLVYESVLSGYTVLLCLNVFL